MSSFADQQFSSSFDQETSSRFTYRDLKNLARFAPACPLRVIALIDFDAFYAQCETVRLGLPPDKPLAVQQWNAIIALNYAAKAAGLKRIITPDEAKLQCPHVILQHVATWREGDPNWAYRDDVRSHMKTDKAALDPYRQQSRKAFELIKSLLPPSPVQKVEKASIDEVFLDLSHQVHLRLLERFPHLAAEEDQTDPDTRLPMPQTTFLDWTGSKVIGAETEVEMEAPDWDDVALNLGSEIVQEIRQQIYQHLRYTCSAGVARNKPLAKLAAGHNKPNQQTIVRARAIPDFLSSYKFTKIRGLGGKLGHKITESLHTEEMSELLKISLEDLRSKIGAESASWVFNVIRGNDFSEVVERTQLQSMLAAKTFVPKAQGMEQAEKWLRIFAGDLMGRLDEQDAASAHRRPRVVALHHAIEGRFGPTRSKQMQIPLGARINTQLLFNLFRSLLVQISHDGPTWPCLGLSVSLSHFEDTSSGNRNLSSYFATKSDAQTVSPDDHDDEGLQQMSKQTNDTPKRKRSLCETNEGEPLCAKKLLSPCAPQLSGDVHNSTKANRVETVLAVVKNPSQPSEHAYCCPKCDQHIVDSDILEHLDWHVAMELQNS